jgi:hypothetical protein
MKYGKLNKPIIRFKDELFTDRGRCKGEEVAYEAVVNYREWATTKAL